MCYSLTITRLTSVTFFFKLYGDQRDLPVLTHSFPKRRSSDLCRAQACQARASAGKAGNRPRRRAGLCPPHDDGVRRDRGGALRQLGPDRVRSEEHTSELQSLMRISYAVFCLKKKKQHHLSAMHVHEYHMPPFQ